MPATTERQRRLFCIALSIKRGETPATYSAEAAKLAETMSEEELETYCKSEVRKPARE